MDQLKEEISSFPSETTVWSTQGSVKNSPGNLAMHLCGNLKHNFGAVLLGNGNQRNRDYEFSQMDTPKQVIMNEIDSTISVVKEAFEKMKPEDLQKIFPADNFGTGQTIGSVLLRLAFHLSYHLGQINYYRRMI
ncbi:MAG: DUF1572 domain-containing protein [Ignavibacteria bacterium]|nr:DUF1572 domain-containing protein [Ignavibacteria bacterium]